MMLWTVLWLVGGIAGGLVAAWMLISAAGMDGPRRGLHGRGGVTACGACGHEAVTPDRISACPECGEAYADAGLLTPRAGLRYGPPMPIIGLLLLSGVVLGSALLAPQAGMAANRSAIGGAQVESRRMTSSFEPKIHGVTVPPARIYWLGFHRDTLIARSPGQWNPSSPVIAGSMEVEIIVGSAPHAPAPSPTSSSTPRFRLLLEGFLASDWRIVDGANVERARGSDGREAGVAELFRVAGISPDGSAWPGARDELNMAQRIVTVHAAAGSGRVVGLPSPGLYGLTTQGTMTTVRGTSTFHRASPLGIAAGAGTPVVLSGVALGVLGLICWLRRRMVA